MVILSPHTVGKGLRNPLGLDGALQWDQSGLEDFADQVLNQAPHTRRLGEIGVMVRSHQCLGTDFFSDSPSACSSEEQKLGDEPDLAWI